MAKCKHKMGVCPLCGHERLLDSKDHLPPDSMYPKELKVTNYIPRLYKKRCCTKCNNETKNNDTLFKVVFGSLAEVHWSDALVDSVGRTIEKGNLSRYLKENTYYEEVEGRLVKGLEVHQAQLDPVFHKMVKAYYHDQYGSIVDDGCFVDTIPKDHIHQVHRNEIEKKWNGLDWVEVNKGSVSYSFMEMDSGQGVYCFIDIFGVYTFWFVVLKKGKK
ncbi:hypothetical protein [Alcanivorax sp.]|jgi:hypothetical protein|uniref:hypothetical protein n=1 Tax=Alcanivorax sp. TaxID=1872427 RepID=UPI0032D928DB